MQKSNGTLTVVAPPTFQRKLTKRGMTAAREGPVAGIL